MQIILSIVLYAIVLWCLGYRFGDLDMAETLPYAKWILNPHLYANDFFIQAISQQIPNERWVFAHLLAWFPGIFPIKCFILHAFFSILLIWSWVKIVSQYIQDIWIVSFTIIIIFIVGNKLSLGDNQLYYNYLNPSLVAKSMASFSLFLFLRKKYLYTGIFLAIATFIQVLVGLQLAVILSIVCLVQIVLNKKAWKHLLQFGIYYVLALPWIIMLLLQESSPIEKLYYFEIIEARLAHHFYPTYFPIKQWIVNIPLFITGLLVWRKLDRRIFLFVLIALIIACVYCLNTAYTISPSILKSQWFKSTIWVEGFSFVAIIYWVYFGVLKSRINKLILHASCIFFGVAILLFFKTDVGLAEPWGPLNDEKKLAQLIPDLGPNSALMIPSEMTAIRPYSEQNLFIDYKSNLHSTAYLKDAIERRKWVYGATLEARRTAAFFNQHMESHYANLTLEDLKQLNREGATHILTKSNYPELQSVFESHGYTIYMITD